jgi:hypothetical protein
MKRLLFAILPLALLLASCTKEDITAPQVDESAWLQQERGVVVYQGFGCDFFVVETMRGYTLLRNWGGISPMTGSVIYGELSRWGVRQFYVRSEGRIVTADVRDYWMNYFSVQDALQSLCRGGW